MKLAPTSCALVLAIAVWISAVTAADPDEVRVFPRAIPLEIVGHSNFGRFELGLKLIRPAHADDGRADVRIRECPCDRRGHE